MAIGPLMVGPKPPDVTLPITLPSELRISAPSPAGALALDARGAGKPALLAPSAADRPGQRRFDRRGRRIYVVAVQAQARFETERVAGPQAGEPHPRIVEQSLDDRVHARGLDGDFIAVLAGIAGAADVAVDAVEAGAHGRHEAHGGGLARMPPDHLGGGRPLH